MLLGAFSVAWFLDRMERKRQERSIKSPTGNVADIVAANLTRPPKKDA